MFFIAGFALSQENDFLLTAHLRDGSVIKGNADLSDVVLTSPYGTLKIPAKDISKIEFGLTTSAEIEKKYTETIENFLSPDESVRAAAFKELEEAGPQVIPLIEAYMNKEGFVEIERPLNLTQAYQFLKSKYITNGQKDDILYLNNGYAATGKSNIKK